MAIVGGRNLTASSGAPFAITAGTDYSSTPFRGIYVGGAGRLVITPVNTAVNVTFTGAVAGSVIPVRGTKVVSTGTDATSLVALV